MYGYMKSKQLLLCAYVLVSALIFFLIIRRGIFTDIQLHIEILRFHLSNGAFPVPPLYYLTVYLFARMVPLFNFETASMFVLASACLWKYSLTVNYLNSGKVQMSIVPVACLILMFFNPLVLPFSGGNYYLGKFSSNIWHNSTTIFVFPFSIWLFIESGKFITNYSKKRQISIILIASFLTILSKPSILFPFVIAFPLSCLIFKKNWRQVAIAIAISALVIFLLFLEKYILYNLNPLDSYYKNEHSEVVLAPFKVWLNWTNHPLVDILVSFAFLVIYSLARYRVLIKNREFVYSVFLLIGSIAIFFLLAEAGPRLYHGNFFWQVPISVFIIHMVVLKDLLSAYPILKINKSSKKKWLQFLFYFLFSIHCLSGIAYVIRLLVLKTYY